MNAKPESISWHERARSLSFRTQAFIDGRYVDAASGATFDSINPATGKLLARVASGDTEDVNRAVAAARAVFRKGSWANLAPAKRKRLLFRFAELITKHTEELALLETLDMGKPISDSLQVDVPGAARCINWYAEAVDKIYDEVAPTGPGALATITREPLGVVGAIVPWNFPLLMAAWKIAPVLAAGNSLFIALVSSLTATLLGTMAGIAMHRYQLKLLTFMVLTPVAMPEILLGVSLLLFFIQVLNLTLGLLSIVLAHITFSIGFVAVIVRARLAGMDESLF